MQRIETRGLVLERKAVLILLYACTIFLSAFLLFQVQPIVGKMLLPWFGGSAAVWSTCLLFFQVVLLLGYLYAHWTQRFLAPKQQGLLHILLLASSLFVLPITLNAAWKPSGSEDPSLMIVGLMALMIGLPYFLLSSTGPLLQAWFAREKSGTVPYRLFALSNFGSLLGLLSYPLVFEPNLSIPDISGAWSAAYVAFVLLCGVLAWRGLRMQRPAEVQAHAGEPGAQEHVPPKMMALWVALAACPTILLMAITSHLTQNVAPVPFLWVLPLVLYLLSFILCFEGGNWYKRTWYLPLFIVWLGVMTYDLLETIDDSGVWLPLVLYSSGLFIACMLCHGELAKKKPHPAHLTSFYLMIALGGALGGSFVALAAPRIFNSNLELPLTAIMTGLLVVTVIKREADKAAENSTEDGGSNRWHRAWLTLCACFVAVITVFATHGIVKHAERYALMVRNFYGTMSTADSWDGSERKLVHGSILHGSQYMSEDKRREPTTYYGDNGGAGLAVLATRQAGQPQRVGVVGLGAGTMASYGRAGDYYRFYEINPLVVELARSQFSFLSDTPAKVETAMGDARLSLERENPQRFDALVVDAFSGDSIPVHLLTREAFAVYFRHMKPGGILAVHISNRNLDLAPVVKHAVDYYRKEARLVDADPDYGRGLSGSSWILISDDAAVLESEALYDHVEEVELERNIPPWTDDYSSIYTILK
ncbi:fused MFS/spermidine synthase [Oxalobacteraceae bacterium R-40]|uniref:Fused MFS/spermidine synthase n=1 Tax=Keguizhuia sedimenti TaxID=3064264 RepID=A0ABU1BRQ6_9BURK|nr:fused MFS/spermidine synthase [Oxalobacteraceae bacterium R-40]